MLFYLRSPKARPTLRIAFFFWLTLIFQLATRLFAATVGTVVPILGESGNLAYDATRKLLFISNTTQNRIEVYSQDQGQLLAPIPVGHAPYGIAIIPESNLLLVCNTQDAFLTLIDLSTLSQAGTIPVTLRLPTPPPPTPPPLPETPFSIAALSVSAQTGGNALISTNYGLQSVSVSFKRTVPIPTTQFPIPPLSDLVATGDGTLVFGQGGGTAFLYNPFSLGFEKFRTATNSHVLAADQAGSRFMIGASQFDRQFFQTAQVNPFPPAPVTPIGGVAFSPDGSRVFVGYNQSPGAQIAVLALADLKVLSSFQVPEAIIGRMIITPDGSRLFAISVSGVTVVDLTAPSALPFLQVSAKVLNFGFLNTACNPAPVTQTVQITNSRGGTFSWKASASLPNVTLDSSAGNGPATLQITFSPSGFTFLGTAIVGNVKITSDESISGDQTITLFVNIRNPDQIGFVFPVDGFLSDILIDDGRQRVYLVNSSKNQIEVFSIAQQAFLSPVPVGSIPKSIAFSNDKKQLLVTNLGTDYITELDAETLAPIALVRIPFVLPGPNIQTTGTHPFSIAQAANGVTLVVATTQDSSPHGTVYHLDPGNSTATAFPLLGNGPNAVSSLTFLAATGNGALIFMAEGGGTLPLHLYDDKTGNFALTRSFPNSIAGNVAASADGSYYHAGTLVLNSSLVPQDAIPSGITGIPITLTGFAFAPSGAGAYRGVRPSTISSSSPAPRIEKVDAAASKLVSGFNIVEGLTPSSASLLSAIARQLAVDRTETTLYGISDSGFIVIPLQSSGSSAAPQISPGGIVNGASFALAPAPVAPGSIATIFGSNLAKGILYPSDFPLPTALGGTCITFDGILAPFFYVSPEQLNVQIPWELSGRSTAQAAISSGSLSSQPVTVNLAQQAPGIFTISGDGQGAGAILHSSNFSLVSRDNPATVGETVSIYATGLGPTAPAQGTSLPPPGTGVPAPTDGSIYRSATPTVTIGGVSAPVAFSGLAPGFVGLYQVDVRIPSNAPVGTNVPVAITTGTQSSNQATIAIVPALP